MQRVSSGENEKKKKRKKINQGHDFKAYVRTRPEGVLRKKKKKKDNRAIGYNVVRARVYVYMCREI